MSRPRLLLIDNHDSFTRNLAHQIARVSGVFPDVLLNDADWDGDLEPYAAVFISPGPGTPNHPADLGHSASCLDSERPVLGVCLGMQALVHHHGGKVVRGEPYHGRTSPVLHGGDGLFAGIPSPLEVVRYHSLICTDLPKNLVPLATTGELWMAVRHRTRPHFGVQFHPESILTTAGDALIANFLRMAGVKPSAPRIPPRRRAAPARHRVVLRELPGAEPVDVFAHHYGHSANAFWLDAPSGGRHILGDDTGPLGGVVRHDASEGQVELQTFKQARWDSPFFPWLDSALQADAVALPPDCPAVPGLYGYLGYELRSETPDGAGLPIRRTEHPDAQLIRADRLIVLEADRAWLVAIDHPVNRLWMDDIEATWPPPPAPEATPARLESPPVPRVSAARYLEQIRQAQEHIAAGNTYELCLTNTLQLPLDRFAPFDTYRRLRAVNPAPYAAYFRFGELAVLSTSPERFLKIDSSGQVEARPIKGTAPRSDCSERDAQLAQSLGDSVKERAENLMIVDLLRNDLGRVCEVGSVEVPELFAVESYASVHQLVSSVRGQLRAGIGPAEAVRACFPGGSMTGAPKPRTLALIDTLEQSPRGVYSGALGYFGFDGSADLSIVIRTLVLDPSGGSLGVGGAIVALSDPGAELEETLLKARVLVEALS